MIYMNTSRSHRSESFVGWLSELLLTPEGRDGMTPPSAAPRDLMLEYLAFDFDGNVAICQMNITVPGKRSAGPPECGAGVPRPRPHTLRPTESQRKLAYSLLLH